MDMSKLRIPSVAFVPIPERRLSDARLGKDRLDRGVVPRLKQDGRQDPERQTAVPTVPDIGAWASVTVSSCWPFEG